MLFSLLYVSSATTHFSSEDLTALLSRARTNNAALSVTGMLLYKDGNFMQLLEGEEERVNRLYLKISGDSRHKGILVLLRQKIETRSFPDWSMGFAGLDNSDAQNLPGYSDFLDTPLTASAFAANPTKAQKLLLTFKKTM